MLAVLAGLRPITQRDTLYTFECPDIACTARPGQFVELRNTDGKGIAFCCPAYIFDTDDSRFFSLLMHMAGGGPALQAAWTVGSQIDICGPFGHGFSWEPGETSCILLAEGDGFAPVSFLAKRLLAEGKQVRFVFLPQQRLELVKGLPFKGQAGIVPVESHAALPIVLISILRHNAGAVFSCGPENLLRTAAEYAAEYHIPCQLLAECAKRG